MTSALAKDIKELVRSCSAKEAALLPALYLAQGKTGCLDDKALELVSDTLLIPRARVRGVASFYDMFRSGPMGRHIIRLCTNVVCMIMGAEKLADMLDRKYGVKPFETSPDSRFSLVIMECIGACGTAPAMLVNDDLHENLSEDRIVEILDNYK
jgi:NADH-quinone oxidoreductase E subunit